MSELIYDWNTVGAEASPRVEVDDETLRDGLQSPSVREPSLEQKIELLEAMISLGIKRGDIGLPMSAQLEDIKGLLGHISSQRRPFAPGLAVRTVISDLQHVADLQQAYGIPVKAEAFLGCSRIRLAVEGWDLDKVLRLAESAVQFARAEGIPMIFVTEDTTRAHPDDLRAVYGLALDAGVEEVCIADTVGHSTPYGVRAVVRAIRELATERGREDVLINWHGHSDRGLAVINSLAAAEAGADVLHAAGLGIGERSGNTPMDQLLVNLKLMGRWDHDLTGLKDYVQLVSECVDVPVPRNYPVFGSDAFRTATGVHAAALLKARRDGDRALEDVVYSGVPAHLFGLEQEVELGRMSGKSNALYWLRKRGLPEDEELVDDLVKAAQRSSVVLSEVELLGLVSSYQERA